MIDTDQMADKLGLDRQAVAHHVAANYDGFVSAATQGGAATVSSANLAAAPQAAATEATSGSQVV
jgi:hypothetical protein